MADQRDNESLNERLAEILKDEGYRAKINEHGHIDSGVGGLKIAISLGDEGFVQLICGVAQDDEQSVHLEDVNLYNATYRFAKVFLNDRKGAVLQADFRLDLDAPSATEDVREILGLYEGSVGLFKELLSGAAE